MPGCWQTALRHPAVACWHARTTSAGCSKVVPRAHNRTPTAQLPPQEVQGELQLYAISDLHTDYADNLAWVQQLPAANGLPGADPNVTSVLLVAGDLSDNLGTLRVTLECLTSKFTHVFFTPGNHELWVKQPGSVSNGGAQDSVQKLQQVLQLCRELQVVTRPTRLGNTWVLPVFSWHHKSWDTEADIPGIPPATSLTITDYAACKWDLIPGADAAGAEAVAAWFDHANDHLSAAWEQLLEQPILQHQGQQQAQEQGQVEHSQQLQQPTTEAAAGAGTQRTSTSGNSSSGTSRPDIISFSHFLPHQDLLPEKRFLSYPNLAKAVGSAFLWRRLLQLQPSLHVFGHSHFAWDTHLQGMRFIQAPLCYPAERKHRPRSIVLQRPVWQDGRVLAQHAAASQQPTAPHKQQQGQQQDEQRQEPQQQQGQQEQQQRRERAPGEGRVDWSSVAGMPVLVYRAAYTAALCSLAGADKHQAATVPPAGASSSSRSSSSHTSTSGSSHRGTVEGMPGLQQLLLGEQEQEQELVLQHPGTGGWVLGTGQVLVGAGGGVLPAAAAGGATGAPVYQVTSWQAQWVGNLGGMWSEYYKANERAPDNVQLAPWVAQRYKRYRKRFAAAAAGVGEAATTRVKSSA